MKRKLLAILSLTLILCMVMPFVAQAATYNAKVDNATLKVYKSAKTSSTVLYTLKKNEAVKLLSVSGSWAKVTCNKGKITGYCQVKYLVITDKVKIYTNAKTKIYATASTGGKVLSTVTADYPLYKIGVSGSFYRVKDYHGNFTGYVKASCTSDKQTKPYEISDSYKKKYSGSGTSTTMPSAVKTTQNYYATTCSTAMHREFMVYMAQSKLGCKYSSNPKNPKTFSNYSFVKYCFSTLGYTVGSNIKAIAHKGNAAYISRANLMKGDIVCFDCDAADGTVVDHIGIYVGKGYFVHASPTAGCVVVSQMNSGYYYKQFCWGRRLITK